MLASASGITKQAAIGEAASEQQPPGKTSLSF